MDADLVNGVSPPPPLGDFVQSISSKIVAEALLARVLPIAS